MSGLVSVNGRITSLAEACIPADDRGFLFGDNVFEVIVAFGTKTLDLDAHLSRLESSADMHDISIPWSRAELRFEIESLLEQSRLPKAYIRLVVTRGCGFGLATSSDLVPNKFIYCLPAKQEKNSLLTDGIKLKRKTSGFTHRGAQAKTGNYIQSISALKQAHQENFDDILWTNSEGEFTEASTSNVFFIGRTGDLVEIATPPSTSGLLLGITRSRIIQLLESAKIPVTERVINWEELARFDEAFLCSTVRGLIPVASIDRHRLHSARSQSVFRHIERLYSTWVETELGYRVNWNTGEKLAK